MWVNSGNLAFLGKIALSCHCGKVRKQDPASSPDRTAAGCTFHNVHSKRETLEEEGLFWSNKVCNWGMANAVSICRMLSPSDSALGVTLSPGSAVLCPSLLQSLGGGHQLCFQSLLTKEVRLFHVLQHHLLLAQHSLLQGLPLLPVWAEGDARPLALSGTTSNKHTDPSCTFSSLKWNLSNATQSLLHVTASATPIDQNLHLFLRALEEEDCS